MSVRNAAWCSWKLRSENSDITCSSFSPCAHLWYSQREQQHIRLMLTHTHTLMPLHIHTRNVVLETKWQSFCFRTENACSFKAGAQSNILMTCSERTFETWIKFGSREKNECEKKEMLATLICNWIAFVLVSYSMGFFGNIFISFILVVCLCVKCVLFTP